MQSTDERPHPDFPSGTGSAPPGRRSLLGGIGVWAVVDQCVFSGTNFVTSVVLGRVGGPRELGQYALAFSVLMILMGLQRALLMSPFLIVRARLSADEQRAMRGAMFWTGMSLALGFAVIATVVWLIAGNAVFATPMLIALVISFPAGLLRDFGRQLAIFRLDISSAIRLDVATMVIQITILACLVRFDQTTAPVVLASCSLGWIAASLVALGLERRRYIFRSPRLRQNFKQLWPIGRWVSLTQVVVTAQAFIMPWVMALTASIELAGAYAACWTLVQVVSPMIEGLGNVVGPRLAGTAETKSWQGLYRLVSTTAMTFAAIMAMLIIGIAVAGKWMLLRLYGTPYDDYFVILLVLGIAASVNNVGIPVLKALIQLGHARTNFAISVLGLSTSLVSAVGLLRWLGPSGAAWGLVLGNSVASALRWWMLHRVERTVASSAESPYRPKPADESSSSTLSIEVIR